MSVAGQREIREYSGDGEMKLIKKPSDGRIAFLLPSLIIAIIADKAAEEFQVAVKLQPDNAKLFNVLGAAYAELGLMDKAVENFNAAVRLAPAEPDYRKNLADAMAMKTSVAGTEK